MLSADRTPFQPTAACTVDIDIHKNPPSSAGCVRKWTHQGLQTAAYIQSVHVGFLVSVNARECLAGRAYTTQSRPYTYRKCYITYTEIAIASSHYRSTCRSNDQPPRQTMSNHLHRAARLTPAFGGVHRGYRLAIHASQADEMRSCFRG